jgi:molecular chaperone DnaK
MLPTTSRSARKSKSRNKLDSLVYQMEKTLNENREKGWRVAGDVETAIADARKALAEGGVDKTERAFNQLQTASHKLAEALYQQTAAVGTETPAMIRLQQQVLRPRGARAKTM